MRTGLQEAVGEVARIGGLANDNVFSDGYSAQMASVTGDVTNGFAATLTVGIAA